MTQQEAIRRLAKTRQVSTAMLKPLGLSFEVFLRLGTRTPKRYSECVDALLRQFEATP